MDQKFLYTLYKNIITNKFWIRWFQSDTSETVPVQLQWVLRFASAVSDEVILMIDKDGARCQILSGNMRINKIGASPEAVLLSAVSDLQKEMYFDEKNKNS